MPASSKRMQVEDDAEGPATKREYEVARVPVGVTLSGQVVNFLGCPQGGQVQLGMDAQLPLLNDQLDMQSREQINVPLFTGVKVNHNENCFERKVAFGIWYCAFYVSGVRRLCLCLLVMLQAFPCLGIAMMPWRHFQSDASSSSPQLALRCSADMQALDALTPIGRGQAQLLVGPAGSGKTTLAVDAVLGQHALQQPGQPPVRCVYASVGHRCHLPTFACVAACFTLHTCVILMFAEVSLQWHTTVLSEYCCRLHSLQSMYASLADDML